MMVANYKRERKHTMVVMVAEPHILNFSIWVYVEIVPNRDRTERHNRDNDPSLPNYVCYCCI